MASRFGEIYAESVQRLINRAKQEDHKVAFVVFGLADFATFFKTREQILPLQQRNPKIYPYFETTCRRYESFQPIYQKNTTRFSLMMNRELRLMVAKFNRELKEYPNVQLVYSDALSNLPIRLELLNSHDAWHLSFTGHKVIAQTAFSAVTPSLQFLGIKSGGGVSARSQRVQHSAR